MSIGPSGRIVIEIDPELKRKLYSILVIEGKSMKDWFTNQVESMISDKIDASLPEKLKNES
jgi:hypothetical protein